MKVKDLKTPSFLLNLDVLENNITKVQELVNRNNKKLYPMTKTHKSIEITKIQIEKGASGLLCGTIEEAITFSKLNPKEIVLAYPIVNKRNFELIEEHIKSKYTISIDSNESIKISNNFYSKLNKKVDVIVIINSGLNRLGVLPNQALSLITQINHCKYLNFVGISTHAGQVYKSTSSEDVRTYANEEIDTLKQTSKIIVNNDINEFTVSTGTTPTFKDLVTEDFVDILRPGNYVYNDAIQVALGVCEIDDCSLTILSSIISNPEKGKYIIDAGSKCFGLDKGAHGNQAIIGYGIVKGKECTIESASEEVSIVISNEDLKIGDLIEIIPNHSCSANNMTSYLYGVRNNTVEKIIEVDVRGNNILF